ncbi:hypothetical protein FPQ18DRAFT_309946 [Pyronema domesticum]|nr:hypothetical protein FPQ18DRAFT_309946 [Pyronema domesticum]
MFLSLSASTATQTSHPATCPPYSDYTSPSKSENVPKSTTNFPRSTILSDLAASTTVISVLSADYPVLQAFPAFRALHASLLKKERGYPIHKAKNIMEEMLDKSPKLTRAMLRSWSNEYAAARHDKVELQLITGKEKLEIIAEKERELEIIIGRIVRCRTMRWTRRSVITYRRAWSAAFLSRSDDFEVKVGVYGILEASFVDRDSLLMEKRKSLVFHLSVHQSDPVSEPKTQDQYCFLCRGYVLG